MCFVVTRISGKAAVILEPLILDSTEESRERGQIEREREREKRRGEEGRENKLGEGITDHSLKALP